LSSLKHCYRNVVWILGDAWTVKGFTWNARTRECIISLKSISSGRAPRNQLLSGWLTFLHIQMTSCLVFFAV
jgi:hypothetical protein